MFERFTEPARRTLVAAHDEAQRLGHRSIETEHVLLGLLAEREGTGGHALASLGLSLDTTRQHVVAVGRPDSSPPTGDVAFATGTKKLLASSLVEALRLGHRLIGTEHLALGLVRDGDSGAARVLRELGVEPAALRARTLELAARPVRATAPRTTTRSATPIHLTPKAQEMITWSARQGLQLGLKYLSRRSLTFRLLGGAGTAVRQFQAPPDALPPRLPAPSTPPTIEGKAVSDHRPADHRPADHRPADHRPALRQLNIVARDFDATLAFYRRLGLDLAEHAPIADEIRHAEVADDAGLVLELDSVALARAYNAAWRTSEEGSRVLIGFSLPTRAAVDERYHELLSAGYEGRQAPYDTFWGARYAVVADPDGNDVGLMSPLDPSRRYWPPGESPAH